MSRVRQFFVDFASVMPWRLMAALSLTIPAIITWDLLDPGAPTATLANVLRYVVGRLL